MDLEQSFSPKANADDHYRATITIEDRQEQEAFLRELRTIADDMGVAIGFNRTDNGFDLGFESQADHDDVLNVVESRLTEWAKRSENLAHVQNLLSQWQLSRAVATNDEEIDFEQERTPKRYGISVDNLSPRAAAILQTYENAPNPADRSRNADREREIDYDLER